MKNKIIRNACVLFIFSVLLCHNYVEAQAWVSCYNLPFAQARYSSSVFTIGDTAYIISGLPASGVCCNQDAWKSGGCGVWNSAPYPSAAPGRVGAVSFSLSVGGTEKGYWGLGIQNGTPGTRYSDFYEFDPAIGWTPLSTPSIPTRNGAISLSCNGKGYVFFGSTASGLSADAYEYDPSSHAWTTLPAPPFAIQARYLAAGFSLNNKCYVGFGQDGTNALSDFYEYDPSTTMWTNLSSTMINPPTSRWSASCFSGDSIGYMIGGTDGSLYYYSTWSYNSQTNSWTQKQNFPGHASVYQVAFRLGNYGYAGTGDSAASNTFTNEIYEFNPIGTVGINEDRGVSHISVVPNPFTTNAIIRLHLNSFSLPEDLSLSFFDFVGRKCIIGTEISETSSGDFTIQLQRNNLEPGLYFYHIHKGDKSLSSGKVLIQ